MENCVREHVHRQVGKASPTLDSCPAMQKLPQAEEEELQHVVFQFGYVNEHRRDDGNGKYST